MIWRILLAGIVAVWVGPMLLAWSLCAIAARADASESMLPDDDGFYPDDVAGQRYAVTKGRI